MFLSFSMITKNFPLTRKPMRKVKYLCEILNANIGENFLEIENDEEDGEQDWKGNSEVWKQ
jgi:hypothetical protein